jgi:predicted RNA polymerase sigma factor
MAQRISRAKRTASGVPFNQHGDVATLLRVLYLVFNEGYSGDVDLAGEAIRLTRQLAAKTNHEEVAGLLALMLLHNARRPARTGPDRRLVPLAEQDRSLWKHPARSSSGTTNWFAPPTARGPAWPPWRGSTPPCPAMPPSRRTYTSMTVTQ